MDTLKTIDNTIEMLNKYANIDTDGRFAIRSISSKASNSIYYFPVIVSETVSPNAASMIANNLEYAYMSFVQACFALVPAVAVKGDTLNVEDYLKKFHQNVGIKSQDDIFLSTKLLREAFEEYKLFPNEVLNEAGTGNPIRKHNKDIDDSDKKDKNNEKNPKIVYSAKDNKDIEKRNNIRPSIINVDVRFILKGQTISTQIPVGVKTVMHPVNSDELNERIMDSVAGRGLLNNIVRYTTGEMLSLKDILFGVSKMKKNIMASKTSNVARWADVLEHRKRLAKLSLPFFNRKAFLPNVSLVLSMDDIDTISRMIGYNLLTDTRRAMKLVKDMFLLGFVIVDEATETAYILYDGHSDYEEYPFRTLKRENDKTSDAIDAMIKGIGVGMNK